MINHIAFKHLFVFLAAGVVDAIWAFYIMACAEKAAFKASLWGGAVMCIGGFLTITYVSDHSFLPTAVLGGIIGTYITVKYKK